MAYRSSIVRKYYINSATFVADLWSELSSMGWTLEDNQDDSSYRVYSSTNPNGVKGYVKLSWNASSLTALIYTYWNSTTHTGYGASAGSANSLTFSENGTFIWIYGNDQFFLIMSLIENSYYFLAVMQLIPNNNTPLTYLTAPATAGSDVTIQVNSTSGFITGKKVQIVDDIANGYRQRVTIASITDATHMVISSLANDYPSGARIGIAPIVFTYGKQASNDWYITTPYYVTGNGQAPTSGDRLLNLFTIFPKNQMKPDNRNPLQAYVLQPIYFHCYVNDSNYMGIAGYRDDYIFQPSAGAVEDIFLWTENANYIDSGTSTGSNTSTTLNDTTKSWGTDNMKDKIVVITSGPGVGQTRKILSNSSTQLVVADWATTPEETSTYQIVDEAYRVIYNGIFALREIV